MSGYRGASLLAKLYRGKEDVIKKKKNRKERRRKKDEVLDAVALQDHLTRSLDIAKPISRRKKRNEGTWTCDRCTIANNLNSWKNCRACGAKRVRKCNDVSDLEYNPKLSLAQKRGLVEPPPPKLTESEWHTVEKKSQKRHEDICPICREHFKLSEQVILSCGHVFHRKCLRSFERFVRSSKRACPICRKQNYQKKLCSEGATIYRKKCIVKIQSWFRMSMARKAHMVQIATLYESGGGNEILRQKWLLRKIENITSNLGRVVDQTESAVDRLLNEVDRNLTLSRQILGTKHRYLLLNHEKDLNWERIRSKALSRREDDCPICMEKVDLTTNNNTVSLLSCSHVFHKNCIESFEDFNIYELLLCPLCRNPYQKRPFHDSCCC